MYKNELVALIENYKQKLKFWQRSDVRINLLERFLDSTSDNPIILYTNFLEILDDRERALFDDQYYASNDLSLMVFRPFRARLNLESSLPSNMFNLTFELPDYMRAFNEALKTPLVHTSVTTSFSYKHILDSTNFYDIATTLARDTHSTDTGALPLTQHLPDLDLISRYDYQSLLKTTLTTNSDKNRTFNASHDGIISDDREKILLESNNLTEVAKEGARLYSRLEELLEKYRHTPQLFTSNDLNNAFMAFLAAARESNSENQLDPNMKHIFCLFLSLGVNVDYQKSFSLNL